MTATEMYLLPYGYPVATTLPWEEYSRTTVEVRQRVVHPQVVAAVDEERGSIAPVQLDEVVPADDVAGVAGRAHRASTASNVAAS